jgi:hypothetical protein
MIRLLLAGSGRTAPPASSAPRRSSGGEDVTCPPSTRSSPAARRVNDADAYGFRPLEVALLFGRDEVRNRLLAAGAIEGVPLSLLRRACAPGAAA